MDLFTKQKQTHRLREQSYDCRGEGWREVWREGIIRELVIDMYKLLYLKMDKQQGHTI